MRYVFFTLATGVASTFAQISTPGGCQNLACAAVVEQAARCESQFAESTPNELVNCLCNERFEVNQQRCSSGVTCEWDGNPDTLDLVCSDQFCPGTFDDPRLAPNTLCGAAAPGEPSPRPISPSQSSTSSSTSTRTSHSLTSQTPSQQESSSSQTGGSSEGTPTTSISSGGTPEETDTPSNANVVRAGGVLMSVMAMAAGLFA